jgi:hypothetical protein
MSYPTGNRAGTAVAKTLKAIAWIKFLKCLLVFPSPKIRSGEFVNE